MTDKDAQVCKMFVGGLSLSTTDESLRDYFSKWGEITDAVVMKEPGTRRSRGFGFVTYVSADSVDEVLQDKPHIVDDKEVECKRAVPREDKNPQAHQRTKKVFLGGISPDTTKEDILVVIEQFGKVTDVQIMTEKGTNKPRGFAFAILDNCDDVDKLCIKKYHRIKDRDVEVKKAISQEEMRKSDQSKGRSGGGGGGGGDSGYPGYYPPMRDSPYRGGPPYGGRGGGYDSYRMSGYDYPGSRYPSSEYMRSAAGDYYSMGGFGERGTASAGYAAAGYGAYRYPGHTGYDMNAYSNMYGQSASMGSYSQTASSYGPNRGYGGGGGGGDTGRGDKDGRGGAAKYHPYRRY